MSELTPGELAYLQSGGTDTSQLLAENPDHAAAAGAATAELARSSAAPDDDDAAAAEVARLQELETEVAKERETRVRLDERLKLLTAASDMMLPARDGAPASPPDPNTDIFGYAAHLGKTVEQLSAKLGEVTEERSAARMVDVFRGDAERFAGQKPDFKAAYDHFFAVKKRQLEREGLEPREAARWLDAAEMQFIAHHLRAGRSAAEQIYALAQDFGYRPKAAAGANSAAAAAPAGSVSDEIARMRAGQPAAQSARQGSSVDQDLLQAVADMPMRKYEAYMSDPLNAAAVYHALGK